MAQIQSGLTTPWVEMSDSIDFSALSEKMRLKERAEVAGGWADISYESLGDMYAQLEQDMEDAEGWSLGDPLSELGFDDLLSFVVEWGLNWLFPGLGSVVVAAYEYVEGLSVIENFEAHLAALQAQYQGTFLEDWMNSAGDFISGLEEGLNIKTLVGIGTDLLLPQVFDYASSKVPEAWKAWWLDLTEVARKGFDETLQALPASDELKDAILTGSEDLEFDVNKDGIVSALDQTAWDQAWEESGFFDRINPFGTEEITERVTPGAEIFTYEEVLESIEKGEDKFDIADLTEALETGAVSITEEQVAEVESVLFKPREQSPYDEFETDLDFPGSEEQTITFLGESGTPDWNMLPQSSQNAYIESLDLGGNIPFEKVNEIAGIEWQKQSDFMNYMDKDLTDVFEWADGAGKGEKIYTSAWLEPEKDGYEYNILGNEYFTEKPLEWWEDNYPVFEDEWTDRFEDLWEQGDYYLPYTETLSGFPDRNFNLTTPTGGRLATQPMEFYNKQHIIPQKITTDPLFEYQGPDILTKSKKLAGKQIIGPDVEKFVSGPGGGTWVSELVDQIRGLTPIRGKATGLVEDPIAGVSETVGGEPWSTWEAILNPQGKSYYEQITKQKPFDMVSPLSGLNKMFPRLGGVVEEKLPDWWADSSIWDFAKKGGSVLSQWAAPWMWENVTAPQYAAQFAKLTGQPFDPSSVANRYGYYGELPAYEQLFGRRPQVNPYLLKQAAGYI